ncbi:MAG: recombinase RecT [Thermoplasmata archaeon]|nr:recombinase RecT [Thermoplasmata archaeon]
MTAPEFETAAALKEREDAGRSLAAAPAAEDAQIIDWTPPKEWSRGWRDLVLDLVDPQRQLTDVETAYFFARAKALALDPLARQIFPVKLNGRMEPFVGIHGIRMLAERTGERGSEAVTLRTYAGEMPALVSVEVTVWRKGNAYAFKANMAEFAQKNSLPGSSWAVKPEVMLTKCAAANAYRMAFPEVLGGLYIVEEVA